MRLPSGLNLPLNNMAIPIYAAPSREDVEIGGHVLLQGDGDVAAQAISPAFNIPEGYYTAILKEMGEKLHKLADMFAQNQQRRDIQVLGVLSYLVNNICEWVQAHGGWRQVFSDIFTVIYNISKIAALGVFIGCGIVWIRNNK